MATMENKLQEKLSIRLVDQISLKKKSTWLVEQENKKTMVLKMANNESRHKVKRIIRALFGNPLIFEASIYKNFPYKTYSVLKTPDLISTDEKTYLLLDRVEGEKGWNRHLISDQIMAAGLYEFNTSHLKWTQNPFRALFFKMWNNLEFQILKALIKLFLKKMIDFDTFVHYIKICLNQSGTQKRVKRENTFFLHNDLFGPNNIITGTGGQLYLCDFECVIKERKWILKDVIELAFDKQSMHNLQINVDLIQCYMEMIKDKYDLEVRLESQIRVVLIARTSRIMLSKSETISESDKRQAEFFFRKILLNEVEFCDWLRKQRIY